MYLGPLANFTFLWLEGHRQFVPIVTGETAARGTEKLENPFKAQQPCNCMRPPCSATFCDSRTFMKERKGEKNPSCKHAFSQTYSLRPLKQHNAGSSGVKNGPIHNQQQQVVVGISTQSNLAGRVGQEFKKATIWSAKLERGQETRVNTSPLPKNTTWPGTTVNGQGPGFTVRPKKLQGGTRRLRAQFWSGLLYGMGQSTLLLSAPSRLCAQLSGFPPPSWGSVTVC